MCTLNSWRRSNAVCELIRHSLLELCHGSLCDLSFRFWHLRCRIDRLLAEEFYVASWNVENLFDLEDDPSVEGDEEFTPNRPKQWTAEAAGDQAQQPGQASSAR